MSPSVHVVRRSEANHVGGSGDIGPPPRIASRAMRSRGGRSTFLLNLSRGEPRSSSASSCGNVVLGRCRLGAVGGPWEYFVLQALGCERLEGRRETRKTTAVIRWMWSPVMCLVFVRRRRRPRLARVLESDIRLPTLRGGQTAHQGNTRGLSMFRETHRKILAKSVAPLMADIVVRSSLTHFKRVRMTVSTVRHFAVA
ncbi:hypothetical protein BV20DRAFT_447841 [Pilatotrama ljubarskyi]|nr:hypothetical protein BV20DRAFT_447841 [Pilatotrama ljubarskyi]